MSQFNFSTNVIAIQQPTNATGTIIHNPSIVDVVAIYLIISALNRYNEAFTVDAINFDFLLTNMFFDTRNIVSNNVAIMIKNMLLIYFLYF